MPAVRTNVGELAGRVGEAVADVERRQSFLRVDEIGAESRRTGGDAIGEGDGRDRRRLVDAERLGVGRAVRGRRRAVERVADRRAGAAGLERDLGGLSERAGAGRQRRLLGGRRRLRLLLVLRLVLGGRGCRHEHGDGESGDPAARRHVDSPEGGRSSIVRGSGAGVEAKVIRNSSSSSLTSRRMVYPSLAETVEGDRTFPARDKPHRSPRSSPERTWRMHPFSRFS